MGIGSWAAQVFLINNVLYYHISQTSRPEKVITSAVLLSPVFIFLVFAWPTRLEGGRHLFPVWRFMNGLAWLRQTIKNRKEERKLQGGVVNGIVCRSTHGTELLPKPVNIHAFLWENLTEVTARNNNFMAFFVHGKKIQPRLSLTHGLSSSVREKWRHGKIFTRET